MGTTRDPSVTCCLILGGGEIRDYGRAGRMVPPGCFVVCADSGLGHCERLGVTPDLAVGDFDSSESPPPGVETLFLPWDKDFTDSTMAMREAVRRGFGRLLFFGVLGGRPDHSLANLQNLIWCAENGVSAVLSDGLTDMFAVRDGTITLEPRDNCYFSVFAASPVCEGVTITNGKYPLDNYNLEYNTPRAVSNEFTGQPAKISVRRGTIIAVATPKD